MDTAIDGIEEKRGLKLNRKGRRSHDLFHTVCICVPLQHYDTLRCHIRARPHTISLEDRWRIKRCGHLVTMTIDSV